MDKIAILIPCYNEGKTIGKVITDFRHHLPEAAIYVYDNNSTDTTVQIALSMGVIVRHEKKQGKGFVIRRMFREIDADCYLLVDGDDTYPAETALEMCQNITEQQYDMVIGDRLSTTYHKQNKRPFHDWGNEFVRSAINKLFNCSVNDILTGYRAFSYLFVKSFPVLSRGFEIETEMTIHAVENHLAIIGIPVLYRDRPKGSFSKLNTISDGIKILRTILRLYKNHKSLLFFGIIAAFLVVLAIIFLIPILIAFIETGKVEKFPTLFVCGFTIIAALQCFFSGLVLSTVYQKNLQDFELRMIDVYHSYLEKNK